MEYDPYFHKKTIAPVMGGNDRSLSMLGTIGMESAQDDRWLVGIVAAGVAAV